MPSVVRKWRPRIRALRRRKVKPSGIRSRYVSSVDPPLESSDQEAFEKYFGEHSMGIDPEAERAWIKGLHC